MNKGDVNIDNEHRRGDRYGRDIGIVYCDGINLDAALMENNLARIYTEYCNISEFSMKNGQNHIVNIIKYLDFMF
jgi:micrococcal nuclease